MILRAPVHLLALFGLLIALGSQTARSQPFQQPAPSATRESQPISAHTITSSAAPQQPGIVATAALTNTIFLPNIVKVAPPLVDLSINSLEITQAVQTLSNSVPLVAGRAAIVRVYATYAGTPAPGSVSVSLTGTRA